MAQEKTITTPTLERLQRHGEHLFKEAESLGWKDDGEGPLEFMKRIAYETGWNDAKGI